MQREKFLTALTAGIGFLTLAVVLAYHRAVDGDLWARLAVGANFFQHHAVWRHDVFAFTPTLPQWIDHEWGAGVIFFALLKWFGPGALLLFKIGTAWAALGVCLAAARLNGARSAVILLLAIPCALAMLPGFVPVIRSHVFTYLFFGGLLCGLELIRAGRRWPAFLIVPLLLVWVNVHGGFVVGLGVIAVYAVFVPAARTTLLITLLGCLAVSCVNPYGSQFWTYLIPALLHPRTDITEWAPMPLWGTWRSDPYLGFPLLFVIAVMVVVAGRKHGSWLALTMLVVTAAFAWRSRRHAPFFGLAAAVYLAPYLDGLLARKFPWQIPALLTQGALAVFVCVKFLPMIALAPVTRPEFYPVRAVDILAEAKVTGNLAVPFRWGSYAAWRLYPRIHVDIDGRYEETYPETTFAMNRDFYYKVGADWDQLLRNHRVDFIIVETRAARVTLADLRERSYELVWADAASALLARRESVPGLRAGLHQLPATTADPLDPHIPDRWW